MLKIAKRGRNLSLKCYVYCICTIMFYLFINLLKFYRNLYQSERKLVYPFLYPYNTKESPNYELTYFIQLSGGIYSALINSTVDSFVSMLLLHVCAQLKNLRITLNKLVEKLAERSISLSRFRKGLLAVIVRHEDLIRYMLCICLMFYGIFLHFFSIVFFTHMNEGSDSY